MYIHLNFGDPKLYKLSSAKVIKLSSAQKCHKPYILVNFLWELKVLGGVNKIRDFQSF